MTASVAESQIQAAVGASSANTTATFTATPSTGYEFAGWGTTADATSYESTANPYQSTITNSTPGSTANKTLYAIFKPVFNFTATADKINGNYGEVSATVTPKIVGDPTDTSKSTQATFTATPNANCTFHGWYYDAAHTRKASDATTYTEEINNNQVGSTANLTLYAWFKSNQTLTFTSPTYDPNIVKGTTVTGAATATASSGLTVTYSSSNSGVVSVDGNGNVTGQSLSNDPITVTATQEGNDEYNPASITRDFHVVSKIETSFTPSVQLSTIYVGDQPTITVKNDGEGFTYSSSNTDVVGISKSGEVITLTALKVGTSTITLSQPETTTHSAVTQRYSIIVEKVANTLEMGLSSQSAQVEGTITVYTGKKNNTETHIIATITDQVLSTSVYNEENVITYEDGVIKAKNAGTAKITFTQAETDKYTGYTSTTYDITVTKIANPITVSLNGGSATSIKLKYGESATLAYSSVHNDVETKVTKNSGNYTTISGNTITAGNEAGTDLYEITQAETYKYEAGYASFSVRVNNTDEEEGYVLNETTEYSHGTGSGVVHTYQLSGPGNTLYYQARTQSAAIYYDLYVEYSVDGNTWVEAQDNTSLSSSYKDFSCTIPEEARYVRFRLPGGGTLSKYIRNVKVPRVTYVRLGTSDATTLGTVYTDETKQVNFNINYSTTNGGNIQVNSSNGHFAVSTTEIATTNHSDGSVPFTVTYTPDPNILGDESAVITVSDLFYTQQITLTATAAKRANTLAVISDQTIMVDDEVTNIYYNKNSDATLNYSLSKEGVITFNQETNTVKAIGAGEATLSFTQAENDHYLSSTQRVKFTVNKYDQTITWDAELSSEELTLNVGKTLDKNTATASSRLTVVYSTSNSDVLEVNPATGKLKALSAGANITVTATQPGNYKYNEASITRDFTVISKMDATVITSLSKEGTNILTIGEAPVTIGSNATLTEGNFDITGNENGYITTSFANANNTLTITPVKVGGNVTITLNRPADDRYNEIRKTYTLTVQGPVLTLTPSTAPEVRFPGTEYSVVTLLRTLKAGYSSIALPFNTTVQNIVGAGYDAANDWIAQLSAVTHNVQDGHTLYFKKVEGGTLEANQPYILHLAREVVNPVFNNVTVVEPEAAAHAATQGADGYANWKMYSNYTPRFVMKDKYGVVNAENCNCLKRGAEGSYLNAFTAYIASEGVQSAQTRTHFVTEEELTDILAPVEGTGRTEVYDLQGRRLNKPGQGIHLIRREDGTVRKILKVGTITFRPQKDEE